MRPVSSPHVERRNGPERNAQPPRQQHERLRRQPQRSNALRNTHNRHASVRPHRHSGAGGAGGVGNGAQRPSELPASGHRPTRHAGGVAAVATRRRGRRPPPQRPGQASQRDGPPAAQAAQHAREGDPLITGDGVRQACGVCCACRQAECEGPSVGVDARRSPLEDDGCGAGGGELVGEGDERRGGSGGGRRGTSSTSISSTSTSTSTTSSSGSTSRTSSTSSTSSTSASSSRSSSSSRSASSARITGSTAATNLTPAPRTDRRGSKGPRQVGQRDG